MNVETCLRVLISSSTFASSDSQASFSSGVGVGGFSPMFSKEPPGALLPENPESTDGLVPGLRGTFTNLVFYSSLILISGVTHVTVDCTSVQEFLCGFE